MTKRKTTQTPTDTQEPAELLFLVPDWDDLEPQAYLPWGKGPEGADADVATEGCELSQTIKRIEAKRKIAAAQGVLPGVAFIPKTPKGTAPLSNCLARTAFFAPRKPGALKMVNKSLLVGPKGLGEGEGVGYTGIELIMADQDFYLAMLHLAGGVGPDEPVTVSMKDLLQLAGWKNPGGSAWRWLYDHKKEEQIFSGKLKEGDAKKGHEGFGSLYRLSTGRLRINTKEKFYSIPLLGAISVTKATGELTFTIPKEAFYLFGNNRFAYVDMEKRKAIGKRKDLAKWLQGFVSSHSRGQENFVSVDSLRKWTESATLLRVFRARLAEAWDELRRVGIIQSWALSKDRKNIKWTR